MLSQSLVEKLGLQIDEDDTAPIHWLRRNADSRSYNYACRFTIAQDLPFELIFGKQDESGMFPGYPSPFEGGTKQEFKASFDFSERYKQRTDSWRKSPRAMSFGSSDRSKDNPRRLSLPTKMSPQMSATNKATLRSSPVTSNTSSPVPVANIFATTKATSPLASAWRDSPSSENEKSNRNKPSKSEEQTEIDRAESLRPELSRASEEPKSSLTNRKFCEKLVQLSIKKPLPPSNHDSTQYAEGIDSEKGRIPVASNLAPVSSSTLNDGLTEFYSDSLRQQNPMASVASSFAVYKETPHSVHTVQAFPYGRTFSSPFENTA
ncbi:hypothetical protein EG329_013633 [Mollisiaceae sp. DMI_Dod_QoI]|nr:hypothetical protein EG329_013633 [Helotiales sp. DMI_Dod_QoI]